jgi:FAD synthetase
MKTPAKTRIMVFGTFDVLHKGHLNFFQQARRLAKNPSLIVSIARDANVKRIKGQAPMYNEKHRLRLVKTCPLVDKVVLGGLKNYLTHIVKEKPEIIALGHDQNEYTKGLKVKLKKAGVKTRIIRLKPFKRKIYRSSIIKNKLN